MEKQCEISAAVRTREDGAEERDADMVRAEWDRAWNNMTENPRKSWSGLAEEVGDCGRSR